MAAILRSWRIMAVVFVGVLAFSIGIERLASPIGDRMVRSVNEREVTVTGTIEKSPAGNSPCFLLNDGHARYRLSAALAPYKGRRVQITGVLHKNTGTLDVKSVIPVEPSAALDRQATSL